MIVSADISPFGGAEAAVSTVLILGLAYVVTLLGLAMIGVPITSWLDRNDGSIAIVFVNGLFAVISFIAVVMTSDFSA